MTRELRAPQGPVFFKTCVRRNSLYAAPLMDVRDIYPSGLRSRLAT